MAIRTRITAAARERGLTAAELARSLRWYPSNLSAMDAGTRSVSLRALARVAQRLDCSVGDLLESTWAAEAPLFRRRDLMERLAARERSVPDGTERGWVHTALLAWQRHYRRRGRRA